MADETEKTENETPETPVDETPAAEEAPAAEETPAAEDAPAADAAPPADERPAADEAPAEAPAAEAPPETPAEPETQLTPKERRARRRSAAVAKRGARRASTPEERVEERKRKAKQRRAYRAKLKERRAAAPKAETADIAPTVDAAAGTGRQKVRQGVVVSDKADKTITVRIDVARRHRRYHKTIRSSSKLHVHDERNEAHTGDTVR